MSRFHHDIVVLIHQFNMETPIQNIDLKIVKICLESISLSFNHLDNGNDNILSCDAANGDTYKGLYFTVNFLNSLLYNLNSGWLDDLIFTFFATIFNFFKEYNISPVFNDTLLSLVFADTQDNVKRVNSCFRSNIFT